MRAQPCGWRIEDPGMPLLRVPGIRSRTLAHALEWRCRGKTLFRSTLLLGESWNRLFEPAKTGLRPNHLINSIWRIRQWMRPEPCGVPPRVNRNPISGKRRGGRSLAETTRQVFGSWARFWRSSVDPFGCLAQRGHSVAGHPTFAEFSYKWVLLDFLFNRNSVIRFHSPVFPFHSQPFHLQPRASRSG